MLKISAHLHKKFKGFCSSPEAIMLFVYMKCRFSLSYRDLEEMTSIRGASVDHATLQRWVVRFVPLIEKAVRKRKKPAGNSWRMDETYIKLNGKWIYLYRAVDSQGNTIDFLLRARRNKPAAKAFFKKAIKNNGRPKKTAIDKSGSNTAALKDLNEGVSKDQKIEVRQNKYLNNLVEQDHRFIKKLVRPMLGFKNFYSAKTTIAGIESIHMIRKGQVHGFDSGKSTYQNFETMMG